MLRPIEERSRGSRMFGGRWPWALALVVGALSAQESFGAEPPAFLAEMRASIVIPQIDPAAANDLHAASFPIAERQLSFVSASVRGVLRGTEQAPTIDYDFIYPGPAPHLAIVLTSTGEPGPNGAPPTYEWYLTFHGLEVVHSEFDQVGRKTPITQSDLHSLKVRGDWARLRAGSKVGWTSTSTFTGYGQPALQNVRVVDCEVSQVSPAKEVAANLEGTAALLVCQDRKNGRLTQFSAFYLSAYAWLYETGIEPNDFWYSRKTVIGIR